MAANTANGEREKPWELYISCVAPSQRNAASEGDREFLAQSVWRLCQRDGRSFGGVQSLQIFPHDDDPMIELICRLPLGPVPTREQVFAAVTAAPCVAMPRRELRALANAAPSSVAPTDGQQAP